MKIYLLFLIITHYFTLIKSYYNNEPLHSINYYIPIHYLYFYTADYQFHVFEFLIDILFFKGSFYTRIYMLKNIFH